MMKYRIKITGFETMKHIFKKKLGRYKYDPSIELCTT